MSSGNILLVSELEESNTYLWLRSALLIGEIRAASVRDGIDKVLAKLGAQKKIDQLYVVGHGNTAGIEIGSDWVDADNAAALQQFARLRDRFTTAGTVILDGCKVGHAVSLLQRLSIALGNRSVSAATANQRLTPGMEGGIRECKGAACTYSGEGWSETIDRWLGQ
ncbi:MAG: DUF4347 domain-containing protein [Myxococcales bacterium]|nr:DUF4347 domain-containing protein [Myxococcales bacterium]